MVPIRLHVALRRNEPCKQGTKRTIVAFRKPMVASIQAVLLSLEIETRLSPINDHTPKSLLPICNRPLVLFQLDLLKSAGFKSVLMVVGQTSEQAIRDFLANFIDEGMHVELVVVEEGMGSADALRQVRNLITSDFLVVSGDLITDAIIHYLADYHRVNDSAVTMLLHKTKQDVKGKVAKKGGKEKESEKENSPFMAKDDSDKYYVALLKKENRLLYFRSTADIEYEASMVLPKYLLRNCGHLNIQNDLKDAQCCIFSHWILDLLVKKPNISSIQGELIPFLVDKQFDPEIGGVGDIFDEHRENSALEMSTSFLSESFKQPIRCFAFVVPDSSFCTRVNSLSNFMKVNLELPYIPTSASTPWNPVSETNLFESYQDQASKESIKIREAVMGKEITISKNSTFENSIIGDSCKIGASVKIENSVIFDHVKIDDGCRISNSVICSYAHISANTEIGYSCIGASQIVDTHIYKEILTDINE